MDLTYFGHNTFLIKKNNTSILIDPWFDCNGAFFGSWFQYPINHEYSKKVLDLMKKTEKRYIFVSHEHLDHFDYNFLKNISFESTIIIPNYKGKYLFNKLNNLKHKIIEFEEKKKYKISDGFSVEILISDIGVNHDAAIIIDDGKKRFLNQNDCKVFDRLSEVKNIDYYSVQFSGANAHPSSFIMPNKMKKDISISRAKTKINNVIDALNVLNPSIFLPAAGPAIFPFLDESLSLGKDNIFVHQDFLDKSLKNANWVNVSYLRPGDELKDISLNNKYIKPPSLAELKKIKNKLTCQWDNLSNKLDLSSLIFQIESRLNKLSNVTITDTPILQFIWGIENNDGLSINLNSKSVELGYNKYIKNFFRLKAEPKYFSLMANPNYRWQDISLAFRATIKRRPNIFCNNINLFLFSDLDNIYSSFTSSKEIPSDKCVVNYNGHGYLINRYCPHQGADLSKAKIDSTGNLICPRHGWKFNLNNEGKNNDFNTTINAKRRQK